MPSSSLSLPPELLAQVFPFHLAVDRGGCLLQYGRVLQRLCPELATGRPVGEFFRVLRPQVPLEYEAVAEHLQSLFVLEALRGGWKLRGQVVRLQAPQQAVLFMGSPWVTSMAQLSELGLTLGDYAVQDAMVDYLFLVQELQTALADARRLGEAQKKRLKRTRSELRQLIEHLPEGAAVHRAGVWVYANPAFCRSLGVSGPQALVGHPVDERLHPEERGLAEALRAESSQPEDASAAREWRLVREDGSVAVLYLQPVPVVEFDGAAATLVLALDLTESRRMQGRLMLSDRLSSLGTLVAGVAHEINNPLAYLISNLRFVAEELEEASRQQALQGLEEVLEALGEASEGAERVRTIVQDLRTFSRSDESTHSLVEVRQAVDSALKMVWAEFKSRARVVKEYQPVPRVKGNAARLGQVLLNLLINAAQAIPEGHVAGNEVRITTRVEGPGRVLVEVRDTGCGIAPEHLHRLFDPFFTTKPVGMGTGLGLAICHGIVSEMGGEIQVESKLGQGSLFRLVLPAGEVLEPAREAEAPKAVAPPAERRSRVLVVDDEHLLVAAIRRSLQPLHEVVTTTSAREALEHLRRGEPFDVVLCDLMMPDMSGMELYELLRHEAPEQARRMLFLTGGAFTPAASRFLERVDNVHLEKPFEREALRGAVRKVLESVG
jgi:PAS domain S-box-containing protein